MPYGIIYKVTNSVNSKVYIGQTVNSLAKRKEKHLRDAKSNIDGSIVFYNALKKYRLSNFQWDIIDSAETKEELNKKEIQWIKKLKSHIRSGCGYNMTIGGEGSNGFKHSEKSKRKMSEVHKGFKHTEESKRKMSQNRSGIKRTPEMRKRDSEIRMGLGANEKNPRARAVVKLSKEGGFLERFPTAKQGAESVNGKRSAISNCCNGESKTSYGFKWMFEEDYLALEK